ncbi:MULTISPECIES: HNH endonuclease [unclassified Acinetobacter]|uniref:HNH endonuclease n=1 Tax=unclassified Acinetobacter TaxID=196816 RepID=UPI001F4B2754|nr:MULTISPECIES: HNH endonuclease [unclassified Acinetobacter]MCH7352450.1 HNH endonuclease [Acinetobacter sp. NIPH 2023]MCH7359843.1 HNH endonuclease [Acinetobacter sp. NIPH 2024]
MIRLDPLPINDLKSVQMTLETLASKELIALYESINHYFVYQAFNINKHFKLLEAYKINSCMMGLKRGENPIICNDVRKSNLVNLYGYMRDRKDKEARKQIYNKIRSLSEMCPYCGQTNLVTTLDHYLPQADFPQYSVFTSNLLPSCGTCNNGKLNSIATKYEEQPINPYYDKDIFFDEVWIKAKIINYDILLAEFYAEPPSTWSIEDKTRALNHFKDFRIETEYRIRATTEGSQLIYTLKNSLRSLNGSSLKDYLMDPANNPELFVNHWRRVFYLALANDLNIVNRVRI